MPTASCILRGGGGDNDWLGSVLFKREHGSVCWNRSVPKTKSDFAFAFLVKKKTKTCNPKTPPLMFMWRCMISLLWMHCVRRNKEWNVVFSPYVCRVLLFIQIISPCVWSQSLQQGPAMIRTSSGGFVLIVVCSCIYFDVYLWVFQVQTLEIAASQHQRSVVEQRCLLIYVRESQVEQKSVTIITTNVCPTLCCADEWSTSTGFWKKKGGGGLPAVVS